MIKKDYYNHGELAWPLPPDWQNHKRHSIYALEEFELLHELNRQGYHLMWAGHPEWKFDFFPKAVLNILEPVEKIQGEARWGYMRVYPAPVVAFVRWACPSWLYPRHLCSAGTNKQWLEEGFRKEMIYNDSSEGFLRFAAKLKEFLALTEEQQVNCILGIILSEQFEAERPVGLFGFKVDK